MRHTAVLPKGWVVARLGEVLPIQYGKGLPEAARNVAGDVPVYGSSGVVGVHDSALTRGAALIVGRKGSVGSVHSSPVACWPIDTVFFAEETRNTPLAYYAHLLRHLRLGGLDRSTTIPSLSRDDYNEMEAPIPPLPEQHRIVQAIESYLTRLDDAIASLERVQRNLERYRASVLKAAVEGRLVPTEAELARREGRDYEPAGELLKRILAERKRRWIEDATEKARAKAEERARRAGKPWTPDDDGKVLQRAHKEAEAKYQEPAAPDTTGLPDLPEGWCWVSVSQLGLVTGGITKNPKRESLPVRVPYLRVANVYADELRLDDVESIGVRDDEFKRTVLRQGDLLVVEGNGSVEQVGRVAVWDGRIERCCHQNHLIKVRLVTPELARWALSWLLSSSGRMHIMRVASSTSGLHTLSISKVSALPIPLPPLREALRAVLEIDRQASLARAISGTLEKGRGRAASLRQSILKWAFEGRLVEQDPNDLPAPRPGRFFVYGLECSDGSIYIGQTHNILERWKQHASGRGADWTRRHPPRRLVHWEEYDSLEEAVSREKDLKTGFGRKWLRRETEAGRTRQAGEPASVLLERIKAEREKATTGGKGEKRRCRS